MTYNATRLSNGFHILTYEMPGMQSVAINLIAKVGSRFESERESGISHFLEHMAFKGTKTQTAKQIAEAFDNIGGNFNAYTSREQTTYYAKVLPENTEIAMSIIADIIQNSLYSPEDISKEYQVICQEIAQSLDSSDDLAYDKLSETAFYDQAIGRSILGTVESIGKFQTLDFQNYIDKHYHAENMFLSVAGKVDHDAVVKLAMKLFDFKASQKTAYSKAQYTSGASLISKPLEQSNVLIGFQSLPYLDIKAFYHAQILSLILGGGISSRTFQHIREAKGLAYSVGAFNTGYSDAGLFSLYAGTSHENLTKAADALVDEAIKIRSHPVSSEELLRAKAQIRTSIAMAEEKTSYKSEEIGKNFAIFGKYEGPEEVMATVEATTDTDILNVAQIIFSSKPAISVVSANPKKRIPSKKI
ncbi:MAG: pitrilysin family protein [Pseudomonadota bacterium]